MKDILKNMFSDVRNIMGLASILLSFAVIIILIFHPVPVENQQLVNVAEGFMLGGVCGGIVGYFFTSSVKDKVEKEISKEIGNEIK